MLSQQIAKHFRDIHFGGNWTTVNYRDVLKDVDVAMANHKMEGFHSILTLVYHTHYFVPIISRVLAGGPLQGNDIESFDAPSITTQEEWHAFLQQVWTSAEELSLLIEQLPEEMLEKDFSDSKYGSYFRNLQGCIEHLHYHLGQIVILKKLIMQQAQA